MHQFITAVHDESGEPLASAIIIVWIKSPFSMAIAFGRTPSMHGLARLARFDRLGGECPDIDGVVYYVHPIDIL